MEIIAAYSRTLPPSSAYSAFIHRLFQIKNSYYFLFDLPSVETPRNSVKQRFTSSAAPHLYAIILAAEPLNHLKKCQKDLHEPTRIYTDYHEPTRTYTARHGPTRTYTDLLHTLQYN